MYISASRVPAAWQAYQIACLKAAIGDAAVISITRKPLDFGHNVLDESPAPCYWNIYDAMLRVALLADTPYVAMAEDDVLYPPAHFTEFRPPLDAVSYDRSRWSLFTWGEPIFSQRDRVSNCSLIAPREYLLEALEERDRAWPQPPPDHLIGEVGRAKVDRRLGVSVRNCVEWHASAPMIQLTHPNGTDQGDYGRDGHGRHMVKKHGHLARTDELPVWGKARDVLARYC